MNNPHFKAIKDKHTARLGCGFLWVDQCENDQCTATLECASGLKCNQTTKLKPEGWYGMCTDPWHGVR
tara:strand:- start:576 stop:779 length:204 start_codon:yes stop_codon:yes gene_type:complete